MRHPSELTVQEEAMAREVREGLLGTPRRLPTKYLYDALGSALFEAICELPWYRITQAEQALIEAHGRAICRGWTPPLSIIELGCGNGQKLAGLIRSAGLPEPPAVRLVDISMAALDRSSQILQSLGVTDVQVFPTTYEEGLQDLAGTRAAGGAHLALFLGSNIGNYEPAEGAALLRRIRGHLRPGDGLLLGADLVKPEAELLLAYDDPLGVTAAFDKNLLLRLNQQLDADFDLDGFDHRARWNAAASRIEMHLVSRRRQTVEIARAGCVVTFDAGDSIWTESSHKYTAASHVELGHRNGFSCRRQWVDRDAGFSLALFDVR